MKSVGVKMTVGDIHVWNWDAVDLGENLAPVVVFDFRQDREIDGSSETWVRLGGKSSC